MPISILMTIVAGNWDEGFLTQLFVISSGQAQPIHQPFRLPAAPQIERAYQRWRHDYQAIGDHHRDNSRIALNGGQVTNISASDCYDSYRDLKALLETWFNQSEFLALQIGMLTHLPTGMPTRLVLSTDHPSLWKLPWHLWPLYHNRPDVEIVLDAKVNSLPSQWGETVRILVIEGNTDGIDITPDLACIDRIPNATIEILKNPTRDQLNSKLRSAPWDIIIYAGHSCSENNRDGVIVPSDDPARVIRISDLEASIRSAVAQGLKLMIFNSCDGLGLTQPLLGFGVPNVIVMRESVPDPVAHQFLANFFESFAHQRLPLSLAMRRARVQLKGDEVEHRFPGSQDLPILYQGAYSEDLRWPEPRPEPVVSPIDVASSEPIAVPRRLPLGPIAAVAILGFTTLALWPKIWPEIHNISQNISQNLCQLPGLGPCSPEVIRQINDGPLASRLSLGDKILIKQAQNPPLKEQAAQAMRQGDYREAVRLYSKSLEQSKNDPETVIYLNNAQAIQGPYLKVALAVPIGSNPKVAQQMMRGIAQYQTEVNQGEGINGKQLIVQLANDDNKAGPAEAIAKALVADPTVLAIIGHNATNASLAAAPIYQDGQLPMVMPTSVATQLSGIGNYIFRASATAKTAAETEADYLVKQGYQNLGICYDSSAADNQSYRDELGVSFERRGGRISSISCDVATPGFDPSQAVDTAIAQKIDALALAPHIDHIDRILPIAVAAHGKLPLFSSSTMNTDEVLAAGGSAVDGLVMPTAWHPWQADGQVFAKKAEKFWGGRIIWRTAMTYDATAAVVAGLRRSSTRDGLQQALASPGFEAQGSGAPFRFSSKTHDRIMGMSMLRIRKSPNAAHGYDFFPIVPAESGD
jgi:branched-chain amino acid transport system substrate-binding protein